MMKSLKTIFVAAAVFAAAATSYAQGKYHKIDMLVKNADGIYKKNETVDVWAVRTEDDGKALTLTVKVNGKMVKDHEPIVLKEGKKTKVLSEKYVEPTSVKVFIGPADSRDYAAIGFIVAPEEFRPGFEEPADFMEFWQKQVNTLRASEPVVTLTPAQIPEEQAKYRKKVEAYDLEISMPEGNPVRAYISWPKNAEEGTCGILICPHGAGVRSAGLNNAMWKADALHAIVVDINAHGILNGQSKEYYDELNNGELKNYRTRKTTGHEDFYFRLMYLRMQRTLDYLCTLPQWDGERVVVDGTSQGGAQSMFLAGIDSRVKLAQFVFPALTDMGGKFAGHSSGWPYYGKFKESRDGDYEGYLPYYDGANFLRHCNARIIMEAGLLDETCPPDCVFSAYNVAPSTDKVMFTTTYREHQNNMMTVDNADLWKSTIEKTRKDIIKAYLRK